MTTLEQEKLNEAIYLIRDLGCAIVIWKPDELGDADIEQLEDIMIARGSEFILSQTHIDDDVEPETNLLSTDF